MLDVYENLKKTYENFKKYAQYGTVPTIKKSDNSKVPQNSFYKSVHYINNVVGPVKNVLFGIRDPKKYTFYTIYPVVGSTVSALAYAVLQSLYLAFAYLSYWPAKGLAKMTSCSGLEYYTKSSKNYSQTLSDKADEHSTKIAEFVNTVLNYVCTAFIWAAALIITPLVCAVDKVQSKLSVVKEPENIATVRKLETTEL